MWKRIAVLEKADVPKDVDDIKKIAGFVRDGGYAGDMAAILPDRAKMVGTDHAVALEGMSFGLYRRMYGLEPTMQVKSGHVLGGGESAPVVPDDGIEAEIDKLPPSSGLCEIDGRGAGEYVYVLENASDASGIGRTRLRINAALQTGGDMFEPLAGDELEEAIEIMLFDMLMNDGKLHGLLSPMKDDIVAKVVGNVFDTADNGPEAPLSVARHAWSRQVILHVDAMDVDEDFAAAVKELADAPVRRALSAASRRVAWAMFQHYLDEAALSLAFGEAAKKVEQDPGRFARLILALFGRAKLAGVHVPEQDRQLISSLFG